MAKFIHHQFSSAEEFKKECLEGSAIAPEFWGIAIDVIGEQEINPHSHEIESLPIHDALGWHYPRFVQQIEDPLLAGVFRQADGTVWQLKPSRARLGKKRDKKTGKLKPIKYESPKGKGSRAFLPAVPESIQRRILDRAGLTQVETVPPHQWWELAVDCPDLPILITEGAKKALAALSQGYAAIALTGVNGGFHLINPGTNDKSIALNAGLECFVKGTKAVPRPITLGFDQDDNPETRHRVGTALIRFGGLLPAEECAVSVATWDGPLGKGIDDLIANAGPEAFHQAIADARSLKQWERDRQLHNQRQRHLRALGKFRKRNCGYFPLSVADLVKSRDHLLQGIPTQGIVVLKSRTATGKTNLARLLLQSVDKVVAPGSRESLQRGLAIRLGLDYLNDLERIPGGWLRRDGSGWSSRLAMCMDSIAKIDLKNFQLGTYDLFLDEADQALFHALMGGTCGKDGKRPKVQAVLVYLIKHARRVILASAGVTDKEIAMVSEIRGDELPYVVDNDYKSGGYPVEFYTDSPEGGDRMLARAAVQTRLMADLRQGKRCIVHTDTKAASRLLETVGLMLGLKPEQILRFDGDTSCNDLQRQFADAPNEFLEKHDIRLLVASPSLTSGVSITGPSPFNTHNISITGHFFDRVYGFFEGQSILPGDCMQALARYRHPVPRIVFAAARGRGKAIDPINALDYSSKIQQRSQCSLGAIGETGLTLDVKTPTARYVAAREAGDHWAMVNFGVCLQAELENEGHRVTVAALPDESTVEQTRDFIKLVVQRLEEQKTQEKVHAAAITDEQAEKLRSQKNLTYDQRLELDKFEACQFYGISADDWTTEMVEMDRDGDYRRGIRQLAGLILPGYALDRDEKIIARLKSHNEAIAQHDLPCGEARRKLIEGGGVVDALATAIRLSEQKDEDGKPIGWSKESKWIIDLMEKLKPYRAGIQLILGVKLNFDDDPCRFLGMLFQYLTNGVLEKQKRHKGARGEQVAIYSFTPESLARAREHLTRLAERWAETTTESPYGHPLSKYLLLKGIHTESPEKQNPSQIMAAAVPLPPIPIGSPPERPLPTPAIA